jgi:hypothetical protein
MNISEYIQQRIGYAEDRIKFWSGHKDIQQVWIGIKNELELLQREMRK